MRVSVHGFARVKAKFGQTETLAGRCSSRFQTTFFKWDCGFIDAKSSVSIITQNVLVREHARRCIESLLCLARSFTLQYILGSCLMLAQKHSGCDVAAANEKRLCVCACGVRACVCAYVVRVWLAPHPSPPASESPPRTEPRTTALLMAFGMPWLKGDRLDEMLSFGVHKVIRWIFAAATMPIGCTSV